MSYIDNGPVYLTQASLDRATEAVREFGSLEKWVEVPVSNRQHNTLSILQFERDDAGLTWKLRTPVVIIGPDPFNPFEL